MKYKKKRFSNIVVSESNKLKPFCLCMNFKVFYLTYEFDKIHPLSHIENAVTCSTEVKSFHSVHTVLNSTVRINSILKVVVILIVLF